ncbi:TIGR02269 family lipoprotein [Corallococcus sp. AB011P]|nr:TIGR02269 family lipoprotein [Corallococcus sp. AB011P]RKH84920.1 TIGR02269 family lipoprotein [Corallococcus sp. AB045]
MRWMLGLLLLVSCASAGVHRPTPEEVWREAGTTAACRDDTHDVCTAVLCAGEGCALYLCEDLVPGRVVRTRGATVAPLLVAPGSGAQRNWGSAQGLPGGAQPIMVFRWHRREPLPSELRRQQAIEEWARRPKERHHIFPQAFERRFARKGIDVHQYVIAIDAELHHKIHRGEAGGPWNREWEEWLRMKQDRARKAEYFEQASAMIQRHGLFGLTMTYWQVVDLSPQPVRGD